MANTYNQALENFTNEEIEGQLNSGTGPVVEEISWQQFLYTLRPSCFSAS